MAVQNFSIQPATTHEELREHIQSAVNKLVNNLHLNDHIFVAPMDAKGNTVRNLPLPTNPKDAATKEYVDAAIAAATKQILDQLHRRFRAF